LFFFCKKDNNKVNYFGKNNYISINNLNLYLFFKINLFEINIFLKKTNYFNLFLIRNFRKEIVEEIKILIFGKKIPDEQISNKKN